ncbi:N-Acetylated-Alpha-Linked Acidic Dipeptidase 2 [Manis pentadactyla]|nr:N-Acetylated-Alpha-Linked Acidic Dipeptidase 2 [Manis pentadactyla]
MKSVLTRCKNEGTEGQAASLKPKRSFLMTFPCSPQPHPVILQQDLQQARWDASTSFCNQCTDAHILCAGMPSPGVGHVHRTVYNTWLSEEASFKQHTLKHLPPLNGQT